MGKPERNDCTMCLHGIVCLMYRPMRDDCTRICGIKLDTPTSLTINPFTGADVTKSDIERWDADDGHEEEE